MGGHALADKCLARIEAEGCNNVAQGYSDLRYRADLMPQGNREYLETLRDFGFEWADCAVDCGSTGAGRD